MMLVSLEWLLEIHKGLYNPERSDHLLDQKVMVRCCSDENWATCPKFQLQLWQFLSIMRCLTKSVLWKTRECVCVVYYVVWSAITRDTKAIWLFLSGFHGL